MRHLSRLEVVFASLWILAAAPASLAQDQSASFAGSEGYEVPLTELQIVRSNRTDVPTKITVETAEIPAEPTRVLDQEGASRLMRNEGGTLQWIGWEERGPVWVAVTESGHWSLLGGQRGDNGSMLELEGFVTEIGADYFLYEGTIKIRGAPDATRGCGATKEWRFEVTQNRSYYRLRDFEWCDSLTDYIDIYFPPGLR